MNKMSTLIDWDNLRTKDDASLRELGLGVWEKTDKGTHWLFPKEWYNVIPDGYLITYIDGDTEKFDRFQTDDDHRFGYLAFGFIKANDY